MFTVHYIFGTRLHGIYLGYISGYIIGIYVDMFSALRKLTVR